MSNLFEIMRATRARKILWGQKKT